MKKGICLLVLGLFITIFWITPVVADEVMTKRVVINGARAEYMGVAMCGIETDTLIVDAVCKTYVSDHEAGAIVYWIFPAQHLAGSLSVTFVLQWHPLAWFSLYQNPKIIYHDVPVAKQAKHEPRQ